MRNIFIIKLCCLVTCFEFIMSVVQICLQSFLAFVILFIVSDSQSNINVIDECLECICMDGCEISQDYWEEGEYQIVYGDETAEPTLAYMHCKEDQDCVKRAIRNYLGQNQQDCNHDGFIDCYDYAVMHHLGPMACSIGQVTQELMAKVDNCYQNPTTISSNCLQCICMEEGCGITMSYWIDGGKLRIDEDTSVDSQEAFLNCKDNVKCTSATVENYIDRYKVDCNNDGVIDCSDFSVIHNFGAFHCGVKPEPESYMPYQHYISSCLKNQTMSIENGTNSVSSSFGFLWLLLVLLYLQK